MNRELRALAAEMRELREEMRQQRIGAKGQANDTARPQKPPERARVEPQRLNSARAEHHRIEKSRVDSSQPVSEERKLRLLIEPTKKDSPE